MEEEKVEKTFKDLGVNEQLIEACDTLGWKNPTKIQCEAIPLALEGKDVIGLAQRPALSRFRSSKHVYFACVLSPTRELAIQAAEQFEALGAGIGLKCAVLVGGVDQVQQSIALGKRPHVIIASHPNIYVLDTPSILPPNVIDDEVCSKLVVTGAIKDSVAGEVKLAEYFLSILNLGEEYRKWASFPSPELEHHRPVMVLRFRGKEEAVSDRSHSDFIVNNVRRTMFDLISTSGGRSGDGDDLARLIQEEFEAL